MADNVPPNTVRLHRVLATKPEAASRQTLAASEVLGGIAEADRESALLQ